MTQHQHLTNTQKDNKMFVYTNSIENGWCPSFATRTPNTFKHFRYYIFMEAMSNDFQSFNNKNKTWIKMTACFLTPSLRRSKLTFSSSFVLYSSFYYFFQETCSFWAISKKQINFGQFVQRIFYYSNLATFSYH